MSLPCIRPPVGDLIFQLYGRSLHPELFDILAVRKIQREDYELVVRITRTGHVISFENKDIYLSEVTAVADQELPEGKRLLHYKLRCEQSTRVNCSPNLRYEASFQVEVLIPEIFDRIHDEIVEDGTRRGMIHYLPTLERYTLPPLSFISAEARIGCLIVTTWHTFPDEFTVVKTQSLIEKPGVRPW